MKIKTKKEKIRENYFFDPELVEKLQELAERKNYTRTQLVTMAVENLIKENELNSEQKN
jgi:predicted transcriptional regulator